MKKFQFRLERLLDIKKAKEKEVQAELARVLAIQNQERLKQEDYRRRIAEQRDLFENKLRSGAAVYNQALMFERFFDFANRVIAAAQERIESMEPEIQEIRGRLIEASKERKVLERLRERQWTEYQHEVNREIMKENDDMNQKLYQRLVRAETG